MTLGNGGLGGGLHRGFPGGRGRHNAEWCVVEQERRADGEDGGRGMTGLVEGRVEGANGMDS